MKILILGASGITGFKSAMLANEKNLEVYGTYNARPIPKDIQTIGTFFRMNLNEEGKLPWLFDRVGPDIVLNCVALHNVDYCEIHPEEAFRTNAELVSDIATLCNRAGAQFIHLSTDYVFGGEKKSGYVETDEPNPLNIYARSKLEGENNARKASSHSIIRPSVVYGWTPLEVDGSTSSSGKLMNFAMWVLYRLKQNEEISVVTDQFTSPTLADTIAMTALKVSMERRNDIYHVAGNACINRYDFTKKIAKIMGYRNALITPIKSRNLGQTAKRPVNSCLNCRKVEKDLKVDLPTVDQSLIIMRSQVEQGSPSLLGNDG